MGIVLPALDNKALRSGFLTCYTHASFAGRTKIQALGPCWVALHHDRLVYNRRGGVEGLCDVSLSRHKLTQAHAT